MQTHTAVQTESPEGETGSGASADALGHAGFVTVMLAGRAVLRATGHVDDRSGERE